jgi:hypothetical protein
MPRSPRWTADGCSTFRLWIGLALLGLVVGACTGRSDALKTETRKQQSDEPKARVDLPSPPPESALTIEKKHDDGTFRVEGLTAHRGEYFGSTVEVKGVVSYRSPDCDPTEAKERGEECPEPHMFIEDGPEADRQLMVVGYPQEFLEDVELDIEGEPHVFKGTYRKLAQGFVASEYGLLYLDSIDGTNVEPEE